MNIYDSEDIGYTKVVSKITTENQSTVAVTLIATLVPENQRDIEKGGWYIFCNSRLILEADQTDKTVWGRDIIGRKYHPDFALFRGYAFITSDDTSILPWTTTKTGIDLDSAIYRKIKSKLIDVTRPFITLLKDYAKEKSEYDGDLIENNFISQAIVKLKKAKENFEELPNKIIKTIQKEIAETARTVKLSIDVDKDVVEEIKKNYNLSTNVAVASMIYKYFIENELDL